jgi:hypothetical protein
MNAQIAWTQKLGAAFIAQQATVMNEVQRLRQQAVAAGTFTSGPQCGCVVEQKAGYVTVAPANPAVVYVPVYDAEAIYGPWQYPAYPPFLFPMPVGFAFAPGYYIGFGWGIDVAAYGPLWGWGNLDWDRHGIILDPVRYSAIAGGRAAFAGNVWTHDSTRGGGLAADRAASAAGIGGTARGAIAGSTRGAVAQGRAAAAGGRSAHLGSGRSGALASRGAFRGGHAMRGGGFRGTHAAMGGGFHGGHAATRGGIHGSGIHGGGHAMTGGGGGMHFAPGAGGGGHGGGGHGGGGHGGGHVGGGGHGGGGGGKH